MTSVSIAPSELALSLGLAIVGSSSAPLLLMDENFKLEAASSSFCQAFAIDCGSVTGKPIWELGAGEWDVRQLRSLLQATVLGHAGVDSYEMDLLRTGLDPRKLVLSAHKLDYVGSDSVKLLLSITDVTEARIGEKLKEDMLREKAILLQELQHRVANSLQIIASVLMQSARRVQSDETRRHLHEAHHRIMSVADVQKRLSVSTARDVELRAYFTELCQSLGASMIRDHNSLSLEVRSDKSYAGADISVSLGLVVTELVINALKHAFPGQQSGKITVDYHVSGADWTLAVGDDGVGMPADDKDAKPGLGTSIVQALARQLDAQVSVADAKPGTKVSLVHENRIATAPSRAV